ncbi:MAG: TetR/AcrR family transcriptional regulator [Aliarcobacter sp.]|nr:TetR/AcrR family transcriptional regulator [Aliarcobacter sp.]
MAPRVVDKEQKRKEIAVTCSDLIHEMGIKKLTVAQVAKKAGIGKGTIYEYFENKDDIVFEIMNNHIDDYHKEFLETIKDADSTKQKVFHFFKFVTDDNLENLKHFNGYREYLSIVLGDDNHAMKKFNSKCNIFFNNQLRIFIKEGIVKNELISESINFVDSLLIFEKGVALMKMTQDDFDAKSSCELYINTLFDFIEVKK